MENRALLAFVLSFAFFIFWGFFLSLLEESPKKNQKKSEITKKHTSVKKTRNTLVNSLSAKKAVSKQQEDYRENKQESSDTAMVFDGEEKKIVVDTGLSKFIFSNRGGVIEQVLMKKYKLEGEPINVVKQVNGAKLPLTIISNDNSINKVMENAFYEASSENIQLSDSLKSATLKLKLKHKTGLEVTKKFIFTHNKFLKSF